LVVTTVITVVVMTVRVRYPRLLVAGFNVAPILGGESVGKRLTPVPTMRSFANHAIFCQPCELFVVDVTVAELARYWYGFNAVASV
jgi:hypothetical protein